MSFVVKRRDLTDPAQLQALIVEHADDLERGLTILDSRLLLGQATIDVVGLDADGAMVLIAVGLIADEEMFLKAVEAYSWCLEYPEAIRRLYPAAQFSTAHPPRVMFVVERMPDAFHRKIKQLGFPEVDCVEFRHLDVDGTPAVYFDSLARLRRGAVPAAPMPDQGTGPTAPVANGRPTSLKLQKLLGADRPAAGREPAPIVRMVHRATPRPEPKPVATAPRTERIGAPRQNADESVPPRRSVDEPVARRPRVDEPAPASSLSTVETPPPPVVRVTQKARVAEPVAAPASSPAPSLDVVAADAVTEAVAGVPDLLAQALEAADAMVEPLASVERAAENGRVDALPITLPEPEPTIRELEPADAAPEVVRDVVAAELTLTADPVAPAPLMMDDAPALEASAPEPEPEPVAATISAPEPQLVVPSVLELEPRPIIEDAPDSNPPVIAVAEPIVTEPEPAVAALSTESLEPIEPVAAPTPGPAPSVFSRKPREAVMTRAEMKVSFADMAKDLLPHSNRTPETEPPVSVQRASVEEITRGALDELVGTAEKRTTDDRATAFAKPSGPFAKAPTQKRPRTIAPPPADGQPIAGGPKLGSAAKRNGPQAPATDPAATAGDGESAQAVPEGFEGLQFPNDGVLTRQWMEFLNQMAAGK